jgi:hypothetical protein
MAKAKYHKSQRVVREAGRHLGLCRGRRAEMDKAARSRSRLPTIAAWVANSRKELEEESAALQTTAVNGLGGAWRVVRGHNRWKSAEQCGHHPHPGTHPMVVTTERDWGGWRVPGAEYDLDPNRVERQAEIIVRALIFMKLVEEFVEYADQEPENLSEDLTKLAQIARRIISEVSQ